MSVTPPLPSPPTSLLPTLKHLLSLLETTTTSSPTSSTSAHTRSLEIAAATSTLRTQLSEADKYASGLPGGLVGEEDVEEVITVLEGRLEEGRRTLEMVAKLPVSGGQSPVKAESEDITMA